MQLGLSEEQIVRQQDLAKQKRFDDKETKRRDREMTVKSLQKHGVLDDKGEIVPGRKLSDIEREMLESAGISQPTRESRRAKEALNKAMKGPAGPTDRMKELESEYKGITGSMESDRNKRREDREVKEKAKSEQKQLKGRLANIWGKWIKPGLGSAMGAFGKAQEEFAGQGGEKPPEDDLTAKARKARDAARKKAFSAGEPMDKVDAAGKAAEDAVMGKKPTQTGMSRLGGLFGAVGKALGVGALTAAGGSDDGRTATDDALGGINSAGDRAAALAKRAGATPEQQEKARRRARKAEARKKGVTLPDEPAKEKSAATAALDAPKNAFVGFSEAAKAAQQSIYGSKADKDATTTADATTRTAVATEKIAASVGSGTTDWEGS
jgi:hypothetical protein